PPPGQQGLVGGHGEQPAAEVVRADGAEPFQGAEEGLLQGVLGLMVVAQDADEELEDRRLVPLEQFLQGAPLPGTKARQQRRVRDVCQRRPPVYPYRCAPTAVYLNRRRGAGQRSS